MEIYEVGGCVRDGILGLKSKDIDFSCVLSGNEDYWRITTDPFKVMRQELLDLGFEIFLETPEYFTIRARFPGSDKRRLTADFVLARKEGEYTDGRRPDEVEMGTLYDDLARRDFRMNAIAKNSYGVLIDPFGGQEDIKNNVINTVGDPMDRLMEDALRAVRALRFAVTKQMAISIPLASALYRVDVAIALERISDERIQQELSKMFRYDTTKSLRILNSYASLTKAMFSGSVSLDATMKTKGRGR